MLFNQLGIDLLTRFEGRRLEAYKDIRGILTIGYGCTHHVRPGMVISSDEAIARLKEDTQYVVDSLIRIISPQVINDNQFSACVCLAYNIGIGNFQKSTLLNCIKTGHVDDAANEFMKWNKADGEISEGLTARRIAERDLYLTH